MATITAWEEYPANSSQCDATSLYVTESHSQWKQLEDNIFSKNKVHVRLTNVSDRENVTTTSNVFNDETKVWAAIENSNNPRVKIISIYSKSTIHPLEITSNLMRKILQKYEVHPDFLRVLFSFGDEPHVAEASSGNFAIHTNSDDSGADTQISYQVNYIEKNNRVGEDPWSWRHTGIYHRHHPKDAKEPESDLFIILHPIKQDVLETRLMKILGLNPDLASSQSTQDSQIAQNPFSIHQMVLSSFSGNWRWYFRYLGDRFSKENNHAMTTEPEFADAQFSFRRVQNLRNMNDNALFAKSCCSCTLEVIEALKHSTSIGSKIERNYLDSQFAGLTGYIEGVSALAGRIRNAIDLVGYTLTIHNQLETAKVDSELRDITGELRDMTEKLKNLTQDTVDDSTTVKIITYVSAFYLPGSFVASLYGMNFFVFNTTSNHITIASDFWVFIATWLPLTFITGAIYVLTLWLDARRKGKAFTWGWGGNDKDGEGVGEEKGEPG